METHVDNNVFTTIEIVSNLPNRLGSSQWSAFMRAHTFLADDSIERHSFGWFQTNYIKQTSNHSHKTDDVACRMLPSLFLSLFICLFVCSFVCGLILFSHWIFFSIEFLSLFKKIWESEKWLLRLWSQSEICGASYMQHCYVKRFNGDTSSTSTKSTRTATHT